jgi:hypothetical protein
MGLEILARGKRRIRLAESAWQHYNERKSGHHAG